MSSTEQTTLTVAQALDIATQHHTAGRLPQAEDIYRKVLQVEPCNAQALRLLGQLANQTGHKEAAADLLSQSVANKGDYVEAYVALGSVLMDLGRLDEAVEALEKAIKLRPNQHDAHLNLGNVHQRAGRPDEAAACYRKAIELKPDHAPSLNNLALVLVQEKGKISEAVKFFRAALKANPKLAEAHHHLSLSVRHTKRDEDVVAMESLFQSSDADDYRKMHVAFGLGKAYEDLGRYDEAYSFFAEANALKRKSVDYDEDATARRFTNIKSLFSKGFVVEASGSGIADIRPIFVLGMPRSGTSMVEQILASHPDVHGAGELNDLRTILSRHFGQAGGETFADAVRNGGPAVWKEAAQEYLTVLRSHSADKVHVVDKTPQNFELVGLIKLMLPEAKVVHCVRDPRDTCLSIFKTYFSSGAHNLAFSYDLAEIGRYYGMYEDMMAHWRDVLPGFVHDVCYEELIADQQAQTAELLEQCGLDWDGGCMDFHNTERPVRTASFAQVRKPIYKSSIQAWKKYEQHLLPLFEALQ